MTEEGLFTRAAETGIHLRNRLDGLAQRHEIIGEVRGRGLLLGVEFVADRKSRRPFEKSVNLTNKIVGAMRDAEILVAAGVPYSNFGKDGDHIQISPPFIISEDEIDILVDGLDDVLSRVTKTLPK
jgi:4-aminobutyrate aminotransferase-like enzyme